MEVAVKIIFWIILLLILTLVVIFYFEIGDIKNVLRCEVIKNDLAQDRVHGKLIDLNYKCDKILEQLDEKESDKEKEHFYLANDGYMKCRKTDKIMLASILGFDDLDYCPCCGEKLRKE